MVQAIRTFLDFLYLARLPIQSSKTLDLLDQALQAFHDNIKIFISVYRSGQVRLFAQNLDNCDCDQSLNDP